MKLLRRLVTIVAVCIATFAIAGVALAQTTTYTVRWGDTLSKIARSHNLTLTSLIRANPQLPNPNLIYPGDVIRLPLPAETQVVAITPTATPFIAKLPTATPTLIAPATEPAATAQPTVFPTVTATATLPPPTSTPTATTVSKNESPATGLIVAGGSAGGLAQTVAGAKPPSCGFGSYQGERLSRLQGTMLMTELALENISSTRGVPTCLAFGGLIGGGQTPVSVFVNGQAIPFRGPVLISRSYGDFGRFAFDLAADCGQTYSLNIGVRSADGQLVEQLLIVDVPCG